MLQHGGYAGAHHQEWVPDPKALPGPRTRGDGLVLAVHRHRLSRGLTHSTAADVGADLLFREWHHGQGCSAGQPIGSVISLGIVAHLVDVAVGKGQCTKHRKARSRQALGGKKGQCGIWAACPGGPSDPSYACHLQAHILVYGGHCQSLFCGSESRLCAWPFLPRPWSHEPALIHHPLITHEPSKGPAAGNRAVSPPVFTKLIAWPGGGDGWANRQWKYSMISPMNEKCGAPGLMGWIMGRSDFKLGPKIWKGFGQVWRWCWPSKEEETTVHRARGNKGAWSSKNSKKFSAEKVGRGCLCVCLSQGCAERNQTKGCGLCQSW